MVAMKNYAALIFFFCFLFACREDRDLNPPGIQIFSPAENSSYTVFDTIRVKAGLSDDRQVLSVSIQLLEENHTPAQSPVRSNIGGMNFIYENVYAISNADLISGTYYLKISATDGENDSKKYIKIYLSEAPVSGRGIFIISLPSTNSVEVTFLDSAMEASLFLAKNCDYRGSCVGSGNAYLNLMGNFLCGLNSYNIPDKSIRWSEPAQGSSSYFTQLDFYSEISYVCYYTGMIRGFDKNGALQFSATVNSGYYPVKTFLHNSVIFAEEQELSGSKRQVSKYFSTGSYGESVAIPISIVSFGAKDNNNIFLFGNDSSQAAILLYDIPNDNISTPYTLPAGSTLNDALQINTNTYLLALQDGLYKYQYSPLNFIQQVSLAGINRIKYDETNNRVVVASGNKLYVYNYSNWNLMQSYTHPHSIRDFHMFYE